MKKILLSTKTAKSSSDWTSLILRLTFGFGMFYGHGLPKLTKLFSGAEIQFADPIGLGTTTSFILVTFAEGIASLFIMLGLFTRISATSVIIAMIVAAFVFHGGQPFGKFELPFVYLFGYIAILILGPGKHSLDNLISK